MEFVMRFMNEFLSLTSTVLPYFLFGTMFAAFMATYLKTDFVMGHLNRGLGSIVNGAILGAILPGCSCATVPMAQGLKSKGASLGTVGSFLFASPLLSPQTLFLTYGLLGWKFTLGRVLFAFAGALTMGFLFDYLDRKKVEGFTLVNESDIQKSDGCRDSCCCVQPEKKKSFFRNFTGISLDLARYFFLGMAVASLMTVIIPTGMIPKYIGSSGPFAYVMAVVLGMPVYVCEGEEIPLTAALLKLGLGQGPAMSFLLGAVGTCIPTMIMAVKLIGKKPMCLYIAFWVLFALSAGFLFGAV